MVVPVILAALGYFLACLSDCLVKVLTQLNPIAIVWGLSISSLFIVVSVLALRRELSHLMTESLNYHLGRGVFILVGSLSTFYALKGLPLPQFFTLAFSFPIWSTLIGRIAFREKITRGRLAVMVCGSLGVLIALQPGAEPLSIHMLAAIVSAISFAGAMACSKLIPKTEHALAVVFYSQLVVATVITSAMVLIPAVGTSISFSATSFGLVFLMSLITVATAIIWHLAYNHKFGSMTVLGPIQYSQLLWGAILEYLIWGDPPQSATLMGAGFIVAGGLVLLYSESSVSKESLVAASGADSETVFSNTNVLLEPVLAEAETN